MWFCEVGRKEVLHLGCLKWLFSLSALRVPLNMESGDGHAEGTRLRLHHHCPPNPMLSQSSLPLPLQLLLPMAIACLTGLSNAGHPGCFDSNFAFLLEVFMPPPSMAPCTAFIFIIIGRYFDYQLMLTAGINWEVFGSKNRVSFTCVLSTGSESQPAPTRAQGGGEAGTAARLYSVVDDTWTRDETAIDAYLSSVTYKLCGLERLFFKDAIRTRSDIYKLRSPQPGT